MSQYTIADLVYLMTRLRDPETGCPWDLKQDFASIAPYTLEEVYEVVDTIEREDFCHLKEELGDLLFQVVFYAQLGKESQLFTLEEIVDSIVSKLVFRHPHVFPEGTLESRRSKGQSPEPKAISQTWEVLKKQERKEKGNTSILDDVPAALPALNRAEKIQKRAAGVNFDWPQVDQVIDKIEEEINELREAIDKSGQPEIEEELGDLLFSVVNLGRHLRVNSETVLRRATRKFEHRFRHIEMQAAAEGLELSEMTPENLELLWQQAKQNA